ncbi:MAG: DUF6146 family protein [Bacteroidota bacterium]
MKNLMIIFIFSMIIYSCGSTQTTADNNKTVKVNEQSKDTIRIANDELEYEIIIIEIGFDSWLVTQKPMSYYSQNTLEFKNNMYVIEWNQRVTQPNRYNPNLYEQQIDYDPTVDYGMEVNYKLYMYFMYFQQKYNQKLR